MHTQSDRLSVPINTELAEYRCKALLKLSSTLEIQEVGVGTCTIVGIYLCVRVRAHARTHALTCLYCAYLMWQVYHKQTHTMVGRTLTSTCMRTHTHKHTHTNICSYWASANSYFMDFVVLNSFRSTLHLC